MATLLRTAYYLQMGLVPKINDFMFKKSCYLSLKLCYNVFPPPKSIIKFRSPSKILFGTCPSLSNEWPLSDFPQLFIFLATSRGSVPSCHFPFLHTTGNCKYYLRLISSLCLRCHILASKLFILNRRKTNAWREVFMRS